MKKLLPILAILILSGCASSEIRQDQSMSEVFMKAETAYTQTQYSVAKQHYQAVVDKYPDNINALFKLANINMREKQWDKAMQLYTLILQLKPHHAKAHHNLAMLHLHKASNHLNYYIANNDSMNNQSIAQLIEAINGYSRHKPDKQSSIDRLAEIVKH